MNLRIAEKTAWITGASSGIGAATARLMASEGCDVILGYHKNESGARQTADACRRVGRRTEMSRLDMTDRNAIYTEAVRIGDLVDGIDILVLNAGYNVIGSFSETTPEAWEHVIDVNLSGAFHLVKALNGRLRAGGAIVTVASVAAHTGAPHHAHYAAAKAGLVNLTKSLAREFGPDIRVNCVAPGLTRTEMGEKTMKSLPHNYAEKRLLLQRYAEPGEIANVIVFLASPAAGFMTGATVDVNGGRLLR